jgi:xylulokinase
MAERDLVIGLDCSTTGVKAVVWDRFGAGHSSARIPLPVIKPRLAWHVQPAEAWWEASVQALLETAQGIDPARVAAISIAVQRETFVLTDEEGKPLHDALLWMDERARNLLPEIDRAYGRDRVHQETGKPLSANLTLGKLLWINRNQPGLNLPGARVCDVHAFLTRRMVGRFVTSSGCADPTGLYDMQRGCWDAPLIRVTGFDERQFPETLPPGEVIGELEEAAARACGLPPGVMLVSGLGDGQAAGLGAGVTRPGEAYLNLGTAVVSGTVSPDYLVDRAFRTMTGGIRGSYLLETVLLGGTYTVSWFLEQFGQPGQQAVESWEEEASRISPGADGLVLVPYWNSAMNPYWNAAASGIIVGWRGIHGRAHLYRAILEGVALELRLQTQGVERALNRPIERFIAVGGGSRSRLWRQIITDVTRRPVFTADAPEATALGAGILAAEGAGLHTDAAAASLAMTRVSETGYQPDPQRAAFYDRLYDEVYRPLYPALEKTLDRLADISSREGENLL